MNHYVNQIMTYHEIHKLHRQGHSISYISDYVGMNWRTVKKYLAMDDRDYEAFLNRPSNRTKALSRYEEFVHSRLKTFPDTSAAQMHDWLKEHHDDFPEVSSKTVFNFVVWVRQKHHLVKIPRHRQFSMLEELPYGKQAQVDFGEYNMRCTTGKRTKIYFFTMVLSRSRHKYVWFTDRPFTASLAIQAHEKAFAWFGGIPDEIVYDQDKVFMVSENGGDIILTKEFKNYTRQRSFTLYFCRKADPQSKGKIENVVKYVKQNFLYNRTYFNTDTLNDEALSWLGRTANSKAHGTTGLIPFDEMAKEKPFLQSFHPLIIQPTKEAYAVRKDNTISYKGNFYSLPLGSFKGKGTSVLVQVHGTTLVIKDALSEQEICRHIIPARKGEKVINTDHKRDKSTTIDQMLDEVAHLFADPQQAISWLKNIRSDKPRYIRDQLIMIRNAVAGHDPEMIAPVVEYCTEHQIYSATDFKNILDLPPDQPTHNVVLSNVNPLSGQTHNNAHIQPDKSDIDDYQSIL